MAGSRKTAADRLKAGRKQPKLKEPLPQNWRELPEYQSPSLLVTQEQMSQLHGLNYMSPRAEIEAALSDLRDNA